MSTSSLRKNPGSAFAAGISPAEVMRFLKIPPQKEV